MPSFHGPFPPLVEEDGVEVPHQEVATKGLQAGPEPLALGQLQKSHGLDIVVWQLDVARDGLHLVAAEGLPHAEQAIAH